MLISPRIAALLVVYVFVLPCSRAFAQLDQTFTQVFDYFLEERLSLSGQFHGDHYVPAAEQAEKLLTPALNGLIASNIASFPLSSTIAGLSLDVSTGRPVLTSESLGPIFGETANTIGSGKINIGLSYSNLRLNRFRGLDTDDMRFTFIHQDVTAGPPFSEEPPGSESLGSPAFELDNIDVFPDLDINSSIFAFILTAGITHSLDISLAIPIVHISLSGDATAVINSFTYGRLIPNNPDFQGAAHRFGGDLLNPLLVADTSYSVSTNGIADIAIRLKYAFLKKTPLSMAALVDVRLPTGDERNFLGTGKTNSRFLWIISSKFGDFNPHLNVGYDQRRGSFDSDEIEFVFGFDQKLSNALTFALDILGSYDLDEEEAIELFPGSVSIHENFDSGSVTRTFDLSNIPERTRDNTLDAAFGLRFAPSEKIVLIGNVLVPLNDGGLRSSVTPTFGLSITI